MGKQWSRLGALSALLVAMVLVAVAGARAADLKPVVKVEKAMFAGGCFWKVQYIFSKVPGVVRTRVGYSGGTLDEPTYQQVCTDKTGHAETVLVEYDPAKTTYRKLLETFFANHDPTTMNRQGPDFGTQYRSVIFYLTDAQKAEALAYRKELQQSHKFGAPIVTLVEPARKFYDAEEYHQNYFEKHGMVCH
jgi:peptide-methionine (S)-S-oxide reductase